jgi:ribosomal protein S18 acetylase RimI-like enzyme
MEVRRASAADAQGIAVVHVESHRAAYRGLMPEEHLAGFTVEKREAAWRHVLEGGETTVLVAEDAGVIRGWIALGASRDAGASPRTGEVWAMYVSPAHLRQGIGRALWKAGEQHLAGAAFEDATLWVLEENAPARAFYAALGFREEPDANKTVERGGKAMVELRLRIRLPPPAP